MGNPSFLAIPVVLAAIPVLAQVMPDAPPSWLWPALFAAALGLGGYFARRSVDALDRGLERMGTRLDSLADQIGKLAAQVAVSESRLAALEKEKKP